MLDPHNSPLKYRALILGILFMAILVASLQIGRGMNNGQIRTLTVRITELEQKLAQTQSTNQPETSSQEPAYFKPEPSGIDTTNWPVFDEREWGENNWPFSIKYPPEQSPTGPHPFAGDESPLFVISDIFVLTEVAPTRLDVKTYAETMRGLNLADEQAKVGPLQKVNIGGASGYAFTINVGASTYLNNRGGIVEQMALHEEHMFFYLVFKDHLYYLRLPRGDETARAILETLRFRE